MISRNLFSKILSGLIIAAAWSVLFWALPTLAQGETVTLTDVGAVTGTATLGSIIANLIRIFLGLLGVILLALLLYAGFMWMTAAGDPNKIIKAKQVISGAVVGLVIIVSAFAITSFIMSQFDGSSSSSGCVGAGCESGEIIPPLVPLNFYESDFINVFKFTDPSLPNWTRKWNFYSKFSGEVSLPKSETLNVYAYAHNGELINSMSLVDTNIAGSPIPFSVVSSSWETLSGRNIYKVSLATTTWNTSSTVYQNLSTTTIQAKFVDASKTVTSTELKVIFRPTYCFNGVIDSGLGETGVDCGGACGNCDGTSCQLPGGSACLPMHCASGICDNTCTCQAHNDDYCEIDDSIGCSIGGCAGIKTCSSNHKWGICIKSNSACVPYLGNSGSSLFSWAFVAKKEPRPGMSCRSELWNDSSCDLNGCISKDLFCNTSSTTDEWIEVYNANTSASTIKGVNVHTNNPAGTIEYTLLSNLTLNPEEFTVITSASFASGFSLPKGDYKICAINDVGEEKVDGCLEVTSSTMALSPLSYGRKEDGITSTPNSFQTFTWPTKGYSNSKVAATTTGVLTINEISQASDPCTCLPKSLACKPGQISRSGCQPDGQCKQIRRCQASGSFGACENEKPGCIPYPTEPTSTVAIFTWAFMASAIPPADAFQVVVDCSRSATCNDQDLLPSPTPAPNRWNSSTEPSLHIEDELACVNSVILARFTLPFTEATINSSTIKLFKYNSASASWQQENVTDDQFDSSRGGKDTVQIDYDMSENSIYRVLMSKDILSDTGAHLSPNNDILNQEACANTDNATMASSSVAFCWNIKTRPSAELCPVGCINCSPKNYFNRYYGQKKSHSATPISEDNVCIALNSANYDWEWYEQEQTTTPPFWILSTVETNAFAWVIGAVSGIFQNPAGELAKATTTAQKETNWRYLSELKETLSYFNERAIDAALQAMGINYIDFNFFKITAKEIASGHPGSCPVHNNFTDPVVIESATCSRGNSEEKMVLQSPSPYKGQPDACRNAIIFALFSRNMVDDTILNKNNIILQKCDPGKATSTNINDPYCIDFEEIGSIGNWRSNSNWQLRAFSYSHSDVSMEETMAASMWSSTTADSLNPNGIKLIPPNNFEFDANSWYRVIIIGGEGGVRGAKTNASDIEEAEGKLITPTIPTPANGDLNVDYFGTGRDDYFWYFKTSAEKCPIHQVAVLPQRKFMPIVGLTQQYDADPWAENCNHLNPFSYTWQWNSLASLSDDNNSNSPACSSQSGESVAKICDLYKTSCPTSSPSTYPIVKAFGQTEGQVKIKARAQNTHQEGGTCENDKWGYGTLQVGYGNFKIIDKGANECTNVMAWMQFGSNPNASTLSYGNVKTGNSNIGVYKCSDDTCSNVQSGDFISDFATSTGSESSRLNLSYTGTDGLATGTTYMVLVRGGRNGALSSFGKELEDLNYYLNSTRDGKACEILLDPWKNQNTCDPSNCLLKDINVCDTLAAECDNKAGINAYYSFDGDYYDRVNLILPHSHSGVDFVAGKNGQAIEFNKDNGDSAVFNKNIVDFTNGSIAFWVKTTDFNQTEMPLVALDTGSSFKLVAEKDGVKRKYNFTYNGANVSTAIDLNNEWQHIAISFGSGKIKLYLNGILKSEQSATLSALSGTFLILGYLESGAFSGQIDDFTIFNKAISDQEAQALYGNSGRPKVDYGCNTKCQKNGSPSTTTFSGAPVCGNNIIEAGEQCDDGGIAPSDGCSAICKFEGNTSLGIGEGQCGNGVWDNGQPDSYYWTFKVADEAKVCTWNRWDKNPCSNGIWRDYADKDITRLEIGFYEGSETNNSCIPNENIGFWKRVWQTIVKAVRNLFGLKTVTAANYWCNIGSASYTSTELMAMRKGNWKGTVNFTGYRNGTANTSAENIGYTDENDNYVINYINSTALGWANSAEYLVKTTSTLKSGLIVTSTVKWSTYDRACSSTDVEVDVWPKGAAKQADGFFCYSDPSKGIDDCGRYSSDPFDDDMSAPWTTSAKNNGYNLNVDGLTTGTSANDFKKGNQHLYRYWSVGDKTGQTGKWPLYATFFTQLVNIGAKVTTTQFATPSGNTVYDGDAWVTGGASQGRSILQLKVNDTTITRDFPIYTYFCNNLWPDARNFPFMDNDSNCKVGSGDCYNTNFSTFYCRDQGVEKACASGSNAGKPCNTDSDCDKSISSLCQLYTADDLPSIGRYDGVSGQMLNGVVQGNKASDCPNLPDTFVPKVGYYAGSILELWNDKGEMYQKISGVWSKFSLGEWQEKGLPVGFKPTVGYVFDGNRHLWDKDGRWFVFNGTRWQQWDKAGLPAGYKPVVGYSWNGYLELWDKNGVYKVSSNLTTWPDGVKTGITNANFKPITGFNYGTQYELWDKDAQIFTKGAGNWASHAGTNESGYPSGFKPLVAYSDGAIVDLWNGQKNIQWSGSAWAEKKNFDKACDNKVKEFLFANTLNTTGSASEERIEYLAKNYKDPSCTGCNDKSDSSIVSFHDEDFADPIFNLNIAKPGNYYILFETSDDNNDVAKAPLDWSGTHGNCVFNNGQIHHNIDVYIDGSKKDNVRPWASSPEQRQVSRISTSTYLTVGSHQLELDWTNDCGCYGNDCSFGDIDSNLRVYKIILIDAEAAASVDAIGIRVYANNNHYGPEKWYSERFARPVAGEKMLVDGFEAVKEGRSAYVNASDVEANAAGTVTDIYTDMFVISYTQGANEAITKIFVQMVNNLFFNEGGQSDGGLAYLGAVRYCDDEVSPDNGCFTDIDCLKRGKSVCSSDKAKLTRDVKRIADLQTIISGLLSYFNNPRCNNDQSRTCKANSDCYGGGTCGNFYPVLKAGSYIANKTFSAWPSWQATLGQAIGLTLPVDPLNKFVGCSAPYDSTTCWDDQAKQMSCSFSADSAVYSYYSSLNGKKYDFSIKGEFNSNGNKWQPAWSQVNNLRLNPFSSYTLGGICSAVLPTCGNGNGSAIDPGEDCSNCWIDNACPANQYCKLTGSTWGCAPVINCGNGIQDSGEECDDDNMTNGDGCSASCQLEAGWAKMFGTNETITYGNYGNYSWNLGDNVPVTIKEFGTNKYLQDDGTGRLMLLPGVPAEKLYFATSSCNHTQVNQAYTIKSGSDTIEYNVSGNVAYFTKNGTNGIYHFGIYKEVETGGVFESVRSEQLVVGSKMKFCFSNDASDNFGVYKYNPSGTSLVVDLDGSCWNGSSKMSEEIPASSGVTLVVCDADGDCNPSIRTEECTDGSPDSCSNVLGANCCENHLLKQSLDIDSDNVIKTSCSNGSVCNMNTVCPDGYYPVSDCRQDPSGCYRLCVRPECGNGTRESSGIDYVPAREDCDCGAPSYNLAWVEDNTKPGATGFSPFTPFTCLMQNTDIPNSFSASYDDSKRGQQFDYCNSFCKIAKADYSYCGDGRLTSPPEVCEPIDDDDCLASGADACKTSISNQLSGPNGGCQNGCCWTKGDNVCESGSKIGGGVISGVTYTGTNCGEPLSVSVADDCRQCNGSTDICCDDTKYTNITSATDAVGGVTYNCQPENYSSGRIEGREGVDYYCQAGWGFSSAWAPNATCVACSDRYQASDGQTVCLICPEGHKGAKDIGADSSYCINALAGDDGACPDWGTDRRVADGSGNCVSCGAAPTFSSCHYVDDYNVVSGVCDKNNTNTRCKTDLQEKCVCTRSGTSAHQACDFFRTYSDSPLICHQAYVRDENGNDIAEIGEFRYAAQCNPDGFCCNSSPFTDTLTTDHACPLANGDPAVLKEDGTNWYVYYAEIGAPGEHHLVLADSQFSQVIMTNTTCGFYTISGAYNIQSGGEILKLHAYSGIDNVSIDDPDNTSGSDYHNDPHIGIFKENPSTGVFENAAVDSVIVGSKIKLCLNSYFSTAHHPWGALEKVSMSPYYLLQSTSYGSCTGSTITGGIVFVVCDANGNCNP